MEVVFDLDVEAAQLAARLGLPLARAATPGTDPRFVAMITELVSERLQRAAAAGARRPRAGARRLRRRLLRGRRLPARPASGPRGDRAAGEPAAAGLLELACDGGGGGRAAAARPRRQAGGRGHQVEPDRRGDRGGPGRGGADQGADRRGPARRPDPRRGGRRDRRRGRGGRGRAAVRWIVDPLDGTVNYLYGLPDWAVSIAAEADGTVVAGAVFVPRRDELFSAALGGGAWLSGGALDWRGEDAPQPVRLACNTGVPLDQALVATGFGYAAGRRLIQGQVLRGVLPRVRDIRRGGSAAVDLCSVASGGVDAYYERGVNLWDIAAGGLIAAEAGARVTGLHGRPAELVDDGRGRARAPRRAARPAGEPGPGAGRLTRRGYADLPRVPVAIGPCFPLKLNCRVFPGPGLTRDHAPPRTGPGR